MKIRKVCSSDACLQPIKHIDTDDPSSSDFDVVARTERGAPLYWRGVCKECARAMRRERHRERMQNDPDYRRRRRESGRIRAEGKRREQGTPHRGTTYRIIEGGYAQSGGRRNGSKASAIDAAAFFGWLDAHVAAYGGRATAGGRGRRDDTNHYSIESIAARAGVDPAVLRRARAQGRISIELANRVLTSEGAVDQQVKMALTEDYIKAA